jgi:signal peptidase II
LIFTTLAILVVIAIIYYYPQVEAEDWTLKVAMGLQLAGASGNLIDRLMRGKVTDFVSVGTFPVFNVADSSITIGVIVLLLGVWIKERQEKKKAELQVNSEQSSVNSDQSSVVSEKQEVNSEQS